MPFCFCYRTLHSYKLFWAVCHLFPQRWWTLNIQSRETICQEDPVTCLKLRRHVNSSPAFGATYKTRIFYKYVVFKHPCSLFYQISSQQQHTPFSVNQQDRKATLWMGLADIHIQWLWDAFQSQWNCPFLSIKKGHFKM